MGSTLEVAGSGFATRAELFETLEFWAWLDNADADPNLYEWRAGQGWIPRLVVRAAHVRAFVSALADLIVADLLRVSIEKR